MKNRVTVTIDDLLQNRVAACAEAEQRSFSAMVSGLLREALQERAKPLSWEQIRDEPLASLAVNRSSMPVLPLETKKNAVRKCRHGFSPDQGCKYLCFSTETVT